MRICGLELSMGTVALNDSLLGLFPRLRRYEEICLKSCKGAQGNVDHYITVKYQIKTSIDSVGHKLSRMAVKSRLIDFNTKQLNNGERKAVSSEILYRN